MSYVTSIERLAEQEGLNQGRVQGEASLLKRLLTRKFGPLSSDLQKRLNEATPAQLEIWSLNILDAKNLDDIFTE